MSNPTKQCIKCKQIKDLCEFSKNRVRKDGLQNKCKPCAKAYKAIYRVIQKEEISAQGKVYYRNNREKTLLRQKAQRAKNPAKRKAYERQYGKKNRDRLRPYKAAWRKINPDRDSAYKAKRRALKLRATLPHMSDELWRLVEAVYAEAARLTKETGIPHHVDHRLPFINDNICGLHVPCNLQILTASENTSKGNKFDFTQDNKSWRKDT